MKVSSQQITVRKLPHRLKKKLSEKARQDGKSMNTVAIEAMEKGLGLADQPVRYHDLDYLAGTLKKDAAFEQALAEQRRIDPEMWK